MLVLCWLLLDGEGVDAAGGHHQHGDEHAELRGVGAPHRGQDGLSLQTAFSSTQADNKDSSVLSPWQN